MKLTKTLRQLRLQLLAQLPSFEFILKVVVPVFLLGVLATAIWTMGADLTIRDYVPFAEQEKRLYVILALFALWILKFLLIDLNVPNPFHYNDAETRKKLHELQSRFHAALQFLKKTTATRYEDTQPLYVLPSFLLIGPAEAGKTTLLANANVHYILQRQFQKQDMQNLPATENCEWWVTRDFSIIDVPGRYISGRGVSKTYKFYPVIWRFFLRMMKKYCAKNNIKGIVIALPLPEILKQSDTRQHQAFLKDLFQRIKELRRIFPRSIPCQIVITKCDLLTGFSEFFAESNNDEINQAWGINLNDKKQDRIYDLFNQRFDAIIKKLNQQLIWRLHQERNPMARPYIKDFPLQVERLKKIMGDFIKQYHAEIPQFPLQGVYLTSAMQIKDETEGTIIDQTTETSERALQLFKPPVPLTRPYFIKQFISLGLHAPSTKTIMVKNKWKQRTAMAASVGAISLAGYMFGQDFQMGIKQAYSVQNNIAEYQITLLQAQDPDEKLLKTIELVNSLQQIAKKNEFKMDIRHLLSFYSYKSAQKAGQIYLQSLQSILLPEIKAYLMDYLKNPVNKNNDMVYAAFKTYLMLGDASHMEPQYVINTIRSITPKSFAPKDATALTNHLSVLFNGNWAPVPLDKNTIDDTRKYLTTIPSFELSYILLKTYNDNNVDTSVNLGLNGKNKILSAQRPQGDLPLMFTVKNFLPVYNQQTALAATEATVGNWVLGNNIGMNIRPEAPATIIEQLRNSYVNNYVDAWENMMANVHLIKSPNLKATDETIMLLISNDSPLLQFLQTIHDNTYFEPLISTSQKLQDLGTLVDKNTAAQQKLYQLFAVLRAMHNQIQAIQGSSNEPKAAFEFVSKRMQTLMEPDILTQMRIVANSSPEPIKDWLLSLSDETWTFLMQDASHYINTSWQNEVVTPYQTAIADHYPFAKNPTQDVDLQKFVAFFGNPGTVMNFYHEYLEPFVDNSNNLNNEWHWKSMDKIRIPFSNEILRQVQHAVRINQTFFPNGDNKMYVQFAIQPYKFSKSIKSVKLNINDKSFVDKKVSKTGTSHVIAWPSNSTTKMAAVQLRINKQQPVNQSFAGEWAWFKLVNQSVKNMVSKKELLLDFSNGDDTVQYLLFTQAALNPFLSLNLIRFKLPEQLIDEGNQNA